MIKLGLWNRLAIVASVMALIVLPLWAVSDANRLASDIAGFGYRICVEQVERRPAADVYAGDEACMKQFEKDFAKLRAGWQVYREALFFTAVACAVAYGLLWLVFAIGKWIWRGRETTKSTV